MSLLLHKWREIFLINKLDRFAEVKFLIVDYLLELNYWNLSCGDLLVSIPVGFGSAL